MYARGFVAVHAHKFSDGARTVSLDNAVTTMQDSTFFSTKLRKSRSVYASDDLFCRSKLFERCGIRFDTYGPLLTFEKTVLFYK